MKLNSVFQQMYFSFQFSFVMARWTNAQIYSLLIFSIIFHFTHYTLHIYNNVSVQVSYFKNNENFYSRYDMVCNKYGLISRMPHQWYAQKRTSNRIFPQVMRNVYHFCLVEHLSSWSNSCQLTQKKKINISLNIVLKIIQ